MKYDFKEIEQKWQQRWKESELYKVDVDPSRPKFYILDMFPYPSGAGLHVGHPLGYIASDIYSRYKRQKGFNVLHPMGFDAFGLPAEQYAIQTGQHPAITTEENIKRYREQLDKMGFSFDWSRQIVTSDPDYYKWTQWAFIEMFNSYYDKDLDKAQPISKLVHKFEAENTHNWNSLSEIEKEQILQSDYRLAYQAVTMVNWCEGLGTVLANDEVKDGLSERGGFPVVQRPMKQWLLRISTYAERLLRDLDKLSWSDSLKEIQSNWIGRSEGATLFFDIENSDKKLEVFTTRPDTIYGSTFMVLAPEHELVMELTTPEQKAEIESYIEKAQRRTERERMADTKHVSGCFTGAYAINPISEKRVPIYISDYVLAGYGSGAIMAVPAHDSRDYVFAKHFSLPIVPIIDCDVSDQSYDAKEGKVINSPLINGLEVKDAIQKMLEEIEKRGLGHRQVNYRLRDAIFSRQRYWGEPIPIRYENGLPKALELKDLPLELPQIDNFTPTSDGEPPLARAKGWEFETSTMPGFAGSSAYSLRYMDPQNSEALVSDEANKYWESVDLYVGGIEHATGHLIYSRFWNKFLFDRGYICSDEPYKKLINQGMIQGRSNYVYRIKGTNTYVSYGLKEQYDTQQIYVDINIVKNDILDIDAFRKWLPENANAEFILEEGKYICGWAIEKMSKSMHNVVNPDTIIDSYGADTLRMYEMFLGPLQQSKPWDTNGIDGVHRFLRRFYRLFENLDESEPSAEELKVLHRTIKKVNEDIEDFAFNTVVSTLMTCLNELYDLKTTSVHVLKPLVVLLSPLAPHIGEELWEVCGENGSVFNAKYPEYDEKYLVESVIEYPVSFNGKVRFTREFSVDATKEEVEKAILSDELTARYLEGKEIKRVIVVPKRIVNIVC